MDGYRYQSEPLGKQHFEILRGWFNAPEVQKWYGHESELAAIEEHLSNARVAMRLVRFNGSPLAYIQDYDIFGWDDHHLAFLPMGSRGIDTFIGQRDMLGKGHGENYLRQHIGRLFNSGVPAIGIDPHPDNKRAIRAYEKLGFVGHKEQDTKWGKVLLMSLHRPE